MGYKPERALTRGFIIINVWERIIVEMGYKPERALTLRHTSLYDVYVVGRNGV